MMLTEQQEKLESLLVERAVEQFLYDEAELLDNRELHEWFDHIAADISYRMPRRLMRENQASAFSEQAYYFNENYGSLKARVERFDSEYAWAERPPTRTRRYVTNVSVSEDDESLGDEELHVESNLLVYLSRGDSEAHTFYSARRIDTLRRTDDSFEITDREIRLDQTVLDTDNISIFL
jgi:3-phenylpropionate/cinnamic acid dioxygenase small subunit